MAEARSSALSLFLALDVRETDEAAFVQLFSEFREEEDLDPGRHGGGDRGFLHGSGHLVWRERAFTKDIQTSCRGDTV